MWPAGGGEQPMATGRGPTTGSSAAAAAAPRSSATLASRQQHPPWQQSPVPYLFGGLAAMLGLIALSLLALACSYWKLSGSRSGGEPDDADDHHLQVMRRGAHRSGDDGKSGGPGGDRWREHVVVIMAGDERPTFLATPASSSGRRADDVDAAGVRCGGGGAPEQGRCLECGTRARPAGSEDDDAQSRSEQNARRGGSSVSVTSGT